MLRVKDKVCHTKMIYEFQNVRTEFDTPRDMAAVRDILTNIPRSPMISQRHSCLWREPVTLALEFLALIRQRFHMLEKKDYTRRRVGRLDAAMLEISARWIMVHVCGLSALAVALCMEARFVESTNVGGGALHAGLDWLACIATPITVLHGSSRLTSALRFSD